MECLTGDAEELVYAKVVEGSETFTEVIGVLDRAFGDKGLPESLAALNEYNDFTRGKLTLMTFLTKHTTLRAKADTLPALPIAVAFGVAAYFGSRYVVDPFVVALNEKQLAF